ncbi:AAA family ATPase [Shinella yambaruensis]|uniref:AAA family ATPase n=1 Tax=Shinella yambaruensis TaxID=415996 RepID=UPI003D795168
MAPITKQLDTNIEELRGMPPPLSNPAPDSHEKIVFGVYDRLLDHGHATVNVVLAPALPDGSPDFGHADPTNLEMLPGDIWPDNPQDAKRVSIVVDEIDGCDPATSMLVFFSDFGDPFMEQIAGPEVDGDIAMRIIGRDIGAAPAIASAPTPLSESMAKLREELFPPVAANDNVPGALRLVNPADWFGRPVPTREWYAEDLIPSRQVTIVNGDGGVGKSLLSLQIAAAGAMRVDTLEIGPAAGRVLYVGAEDEEEEFWRRLEDITVAHGRSLRDLSDFRLVPLADRDALLLVPDRAGNMRPTPLMEKVIEAAAEFHPRLIMLDTAADLYGGDEIKRGQVRQFISALRQIAIGFDCAVVLLAHPSLQGMQSGTGSSGSTAWNNSVRSRLYLTADKDDPDLRILSTVKANYGRKGGEIKLRWKDGAFVLDDGKPTAASVMVQTQAERVFRDALSAINRTGDRVARTKGVNYAPKIIAARPEGAGVTVKALEVAMHAMLSSGEVKVVMEGPPSKSRQRLVLASEDFGSDRHAA